MRILSILARIFVSWITFERCQQKGERKSGKFTSIFFFRLYVFIHVAFGGEHQKLFGVDMFRVRPMIRLEILLNQQFNNHERFLHN
jgi:hypothetical protein